MSFNFSYAQLGSIIHDGMSRSYLIHLPTDFSDSDTLPLVFSLHGLVMTAQSQSDLSEFDPIADRERFIVVYPQGLPNTAGVNAWNTFAFPYHSGVDDVGFISALIDSLHEVYHIDLSRVYSCGMSNGGFMSYRLACELSDKIAAIASVTGAMTDSMINYCRPSRPFPILHFHGDTDPIVNYNGSGNISSVSACLEYWVQSNDCSPLAVETQIPDTNPTDQTTVTKLHWEACDDNVEVIHYKINGGGHTWPGSSQDFFGVGGNINLDVMASELIWQFFSGYSLQGKGQPVSTKSLTSSEISIYPNPASNLVTVNCECSINKITVTNLAGQILIDEKIESKKRTTINISHLPAGTYLLRAYSGDYLKTQHIVRL